MPIEKIIEFILYISPGFLASELYHAFHPVRERSDFVQVSWSLIYGVCIYAVLLWLDGHILNGTLGSGSGVFPRGSFLISLFIAGILLGVILIAIHWLRFKLTAMYSSFRFLEPAPQSVWAYINKPIFKNWAVVFLNDGAVYLGWISNYTFNPNNENQDFLLKDARRVNEKLEVIYTIDCVYLNTRDVNRIEYVEGDTP